MKIAFISNLLEPTGGDDIILHHIRGLRGYYSFDSIDAYFSGYLSASVEKYGSNLDGEVTYYNSGDINKLRLKLDRYDLVIANGLYGARVLSGMEINKCFFVQNFDPYIFPDQRQMIDDIYNSFNKYLLYSSALASLIRNYYGDGNKVIVKCNNGIDFKKIRDVLGNMGLSYSKRKSICFMVAYYRAYKGISLANDIFRYMRGRGFTTVEICSVSGPLPNSMEFYFNPSFERKLEVINSCGIMLHPSIFETWNLVSMESMAIGTPVVGTNSLGIMEYANDKNSIILNTRDIKEICNAIEYLWNDRGLYNDIIMNGLETAREHEWENIMGDIVNSYERLI